MEALDVQSENASASPLLGGDSVSLLRRQAGLFSKLEALARRQRSLVAEEDTRPLLSVLAERQKLVVELADVGRQLAPARREWATLRQNLCDADREEADGLLEQSRQCLSRILEGDEEDARCLSLRKQVIRRDLQNSRSAGAAVGAYRTGMALAGRRLDEQL